MTSTPTYTPPAAYTPANASTVGPSAADWGTTADTSTPAIPNKPAGRTYTIQKGDTLSKIAREQYGDARQWKAIAAANPGINANSVKVGQKVNLP